jgi:hypothetical protein
MKKKGMPARSRFRELAREVIEETVKNHPEAIDKLAVKHPELAARVRRIASASRSGGTIRP